MESVETAGSASSAWRDDGEGSTREEGLCRRGERADATRGFQQVRSATAFSASGSGQIDEH